MVTPSWLATSVDTQHLERGDRLRRGGDVVGVVEGGGHRVGQRGHRVVGRLRAPPPAARTVSASLPAASAEMPARAVADRRRRCRRAARPARPGASRPAPPRRVSSRSSGPSAAAMSRRLIASISSSRCDDLVDHRGHAGLRAAVEAVDEALAGVAVGPRRDHRCGRLGGERGHRADVLAAAGALGRRQGVASPRRRAAPRPRTGPGRRRPPRRGTRRRRDRCRRAGA